VPRPASIAFRLPNEPGRPTGAHHTGTRPIPLSAPRSRPGAGGSERLAGSGAAGRRCGDWTIEQLRQPAQRIADRIGFLMKRQAVLIKQ